jgi:GNAT superfamily N-acetyltransferase
MTKNETLKDGTKLVVRELTLQDIDALMKFYLSLPAEDRKYLRVDVTDRDTIEQRTRRIEKGGVTRLIALRGDEIIADAALELSAEEWRRNQGELRVIVAKPFQRKGLGMILMKELYFLALQKEVETVIVKMMRPQAAAHKLCHKMGFHEEMVIPDYVVDQDGETQDLIIMKSSIKYLLEEMEHFFTDTDWQRCQ